jgi:short-subunit dehydrogenase
MNVIIIGAGNTGFEIAKKIVKGNSILLVARHLPVHLKDFMKTNSNVYFASGDATHLEDMENIRNSQIVNELGIIDLLICTVGTDSESTPLNDYKGFQNCFDTNYYANLIPLKVFLKQMIARNNGRIITISASSGHHAPKRLQGYSPSKWALENTYSSLREEIKQYNISLDVVVVRTLKNKYSKVWTHNWGDDPEYVANEIADIVRNPTNSRHFFPKKYFIVRVVERLFPSMLDFKYHKITKFKQRKLFTQTDIKSALITGAASGLGKDLARYYADRVKSLYLIDKDFDGLVAFKKELNQTEKCEVYIADVDLRIHEDIVRYALGINGIDLIVNNAATSYVGKVQDVPIESYKQNFDINFFASVVLIAEFLKKENHPKKIMNILSTTAIRGRKEYSPYSSAKAALWSFTRSIRRMYGKQIQVIEVIPSRMWETNYDKNMVTFETAEKDSQALPKQNKKSLQTKFKFLRVNNWTSPKAAEKIGNDEKNGKEIIMIPPIKAKLFMICETMSDKIFRKIFDK